MNGRKLPRPLGRRLRKHLRGNGRDSEGWSQPYPLWVCIYLTRHRRLRGARCGSDVETKAHNDSHRERRHHTFTCDGLLMDYSLPIHVCMALILIACLGCMVKRRLPFCQSTWTLSTGSCHTFMHRYDSNCLLRRPR